MPHPHVKAISEMEDASKLVDIIAESKSCYVRDNLSIHLHESQIRLIKNIVKHSKSHHRKVRVRQYAKISDDRHFDLHLKLYLKKYKKLERMELAEIIEVDDLPYDVVLTQKGLEILSEIESLENEWAGKVSCDMDALREMALNSFEYSYKFKKNQKYQF
ncbi:MAG: hypothetical protein IJQ68_10520 [Methanobrevibacter sp.]|uniref:hypothetical protein n=1 Tax=Methanobrevibacter sp. TaxID=66852 RepID=UPI0025CC71D2|nr:hypothetical protein [Methanobrevibacter sp.]MBR0272401.1 hypothetical protein [Methanobrevibacter sp.]